MTPNQRLARQATLLEQNLPPATSFDISIYRVSRPCGTVVCAFGLATLDPILQTEGLSIDEHGIPIFNEFSGISAAVEFYGLDIISAWDFFNRGGYRTRLSVTPAMVAKKIRRYLSKQEQA